MMIGGAGLTLLSFLSMGIIGNLFSSESFAIFRLVLTYGAIFGLLFTLRIDLSIVVSKTNKEAIKKVQQLIVQVFFIFFFFYSVFNLFNFELILYDFGITQTILNLFLFTGIFLAFTEIFIQFFIFKNRYKSVSFIQIIYSLFFSVMLIYLYLINYGDMSPSLSRLMSLVLGTLIFLILLFRDFNFKKIKNPFTFIILNKDYPLKNLPYSISTQFTQSIPILLLIYLGSESLAGKFAFLLSLAMFPGMFLNGSMGKVFFRKTAEFNADKAKIFKLLDMLMKITLIITIPLSLVFFVYYDLIISLLFGSTWLDLSFDPRLIFICGLLYFFSSWPERIFVVLNKQGLILKNQIIFDAIMLSMLLIIFYKTREPNYIIYTYIFINFLYHVAYASLSYFVVTNKFRKYFIGGLFFILFLILSIYFVEHLNVVLGNLSFTLFFWSALTLYAIVAFKKIKTLFKHIGNL